VIPAPPSKRVLVAEDETIIRLDLRSMLEASGYEVCGEARDGVEAVELAETLAPDVILMDVKMPRLDGIEAARRILERRSLPIVMLTAFGQEELVARAVDTGVFGYLAKPFREQDVIPALVAAQTRHAEFAEVKLQAASLLEALEARKAIERAKGILMAKEGISEDEAFARLRRASQKSGRPMKVIADAVAATLG
jgi:response regulator NasT